MKPRDFKLKEIIEEKSVNKNSSLTLSCRCWKISHIGDKKREIQIYGYLTHEKAGEAQQNNEEYLEDYVLLRFY